MTTEQELYRKYTDALAAFWKTHDRLMPKCVQRTHPEYAAADAACKAAYETWYKEYQANRDRLAKLLIGAHNEHVNDPHQTERKFRLPNDVWELISEMDY